MFTIRPGERRPEIDNDALRYEGLRFRAECMVAGKVYGRPFGVDIAFGDPIFGEAQLMLADDALAFAGVPPPLLRVLPVETHLAEKLHAYTMSRPRPNSRIKDLPDITLIATAGRLKARRLRSAIEQTFTFRGTHPAPTSLPRPADAWEVPYAAMAREDELPWANLWEVFLAARLFLDPILLGESDAIWDPATWSWTREA